MTAPAEPEIKAPDEVNPLEPLAVLFRDLRSSPRGLTGREGGPAAGRHGPNELTRRGGRRWPKETRFLAEFTQPLAILLAVAAALSWISGTPRLAIAITAVVLLNAAFAFAQELQAERAVEALAAYLPARARVLRDGQWQETQARLLVPGDLIQASTTPRRPPRRHRGGDGPLRYRCGPRGRRHGAHR